MFVFCFIKKNTLINANYQMDQVGLDDAYNIVLSYAQSFFDTIYPEKNLCASTINDLYDNNSDLFGYCVNLTNNNENSGYAIIGYDCNSVDGLSVIEYAIEQGVTNPFDDIIKHYNRNIECSTWYYFGPSSYIVYEYDEDIAYCYNFGYRVIDCGYNNLVNLHRETNKEKHNFRTLITDVIHNNYSGSAINMHTISYADSISYYCDSDVTNAGLSYACSVVADCNLMKYLRYIGFTSITSSFYTLYNALYSLINPTSDGYSYGEKYADKAKQVIEGNGYTCVLDKFSNDTYSDFKNALNLNKPCTLAYSVFHLGVGINGHVVFVLGYVETTTDDYLKVADGWHSYIQYLNYSGYNYTNKQGCSFAVS